MQEISLNILDIVENSVKAGASCVFITVDEQPKSDLLTVSISDNGSGMSEEQVKRVTDPFFTSRTTRKVGLGVPFFKMAAELTGGKLQISSTLGVGTSLTATFGYSHIDRMPLGDLISTIRTLIQCHPDTDFVYLHKKNDKEFIMDTRKFRTVLDDVALNEPEIMAFISEYLTDGESQF